MRTLTYKVFALNFGGCLPLLMSMPSLKTYFLVLDFRSFVFDDIIDPWKAVILVRIRCGTEWRD